METPFLDPSEVARLPVALDAHGFPVALRDDDVTAAHRSYNTRHPPASEADFALTVTASYEEVLIAKYKRVIEDVMQGRPLSSDFRDFPEVVERLVPFPSRKLGELTQHCRTTIDMIVQYSKRI